MKLPFKVYADCCGEDLPIHDFDPGEPDRIGGTPETSYAGDPGSLDCADKCPHCGEDVDCGALHERILRELEEWERDERDDYRARLCPDFD